MEYHLNRRVTLSEDSEYASLYKWSLQELDDEGAKIGCDMIPWDWRLNFTATELACYDDITIEPDYDSDEKEPKTVARKRHYIRAKLRPGSSQEWFDLRQPSYSMFGTDRTITDFGLHISAVADGEEQDRCTVWGSPSYTIDIDFRDETPDDTVVFHLYVQQDTFERYVNAIKAAQVEAADLSLRRVSGFYSEWSPGISSDFVKVLTSEKEHVVEAAEGSAISPPRLGEVGEVSLTFLRMLKIENPKPEPVQNDDWQHISDPAESSSDTTTLAAQSLTNANIRAVALLASLRTAAWVIAVLLLLILVT